MDDLRDLAATDNADANGLSHFGFLDLCWFRGRALSL
jgi:hypothetical protein